MPFFEILHVNSAFENIHSILHDIFLKKFLITYIEIIFFAELCCNGKLWLEVPMAL